MKLTWRDVFDCYKLPGLPHYEKCLEIVKKTGYKYLSFNGMVFSIDDKTMTKICDNEDLEKEFVINVNNNIKNDWRMMPNLLLQEYEKRGSIVLDEASAGAITLLQNSIFKTIDHLGTCSDIERNFLVDWMKSGMMSKDDILDWETLRNDNPNANLPEVDF